MLFLTIGNVSNLRESGVYSDLIREFRDRGDKVFVVCPLERRWGGGTSLVSDEGVAILRVGTGNLTQTNVVEKGVSTLLIEHRFIAAIKKYLHNVKFDLVLYSTPPVTFERVVRYVKTRDGCESYLMLKDIFPQNAVDLGILRAGGLVWRYFRMKEKRLYSVSDRI